MGLSKFFFIECCGFCLPLSLPLLQFNSQICVFAANRFWIRHPLPVCFISLLLVLNNLWGAAALHRTLSSVILGRAKDCSNNEMLVSYML